MNPIVTIGDKGLSENVEKELQRALEDHELIKVKLPSGDRQLKQALIDSITRTCECSLVQKVGNVALLYRAAKKPNAKLSNLLKHPESK